MYALCECVVYAYAGGGHTLEATERHLLSSSTLHCPIVLNWKPHILLSSLARKLPRSLSLPFRAVVTGHMACNVDVGDLNSGTHAYRGSTESPLSLWKIFLTWNIQLKYYYMISICNLVTWIFYKAQMNRFSVFLEVFLAYRQSLRRVTHETDLCFPFSGSLDTSSLCLDGSLIWQQGWECALWPMGSSCLTNYSCSEGSAPNTGNLQVGS